MMNSCDYNSKISSETNDILTNITNESEKNIKKVIFSKTNDDITCNLTDCIRKPFNETLYKKLFSNSEDDPAGVTIGTYYNVDNSYGLSIYAAGYTEEGEVDFDYIIVNNGAKTNYIELPINSNYSINKALEISGYSNSASEFKYKISSIGSITKIN